MPIAANHAQGSVRREPGGMDNKMPEERQPAAQAPNQTVPVHHSPHGSPANQRRDEAEWTSEQLLDEGRMGNENATAGHDRQPATGGRFEESGAGPREGGHGYGSFEEEGSPQTSRTGTEGSGDQGARGGRNDP
jgi:hypothetical protein